MPAADVPAPRRGVLAAHAGWESLLLLTCVVLAVMLVADGHDWPVWRALVGVLSGVALQVLAVAASLRTGYVNLAVVGIAVLAGILVVHWTNQSGLSLFGAVLLVTVLATVVGLVVGALAGLTGVPGWAASLVLLAGTAAVASARRYKLAPLPDPDGSQTWLSLLALAALTASVAGGMLWLYAPVRRALGRDGRPGGLGARVLAGVVGLGLSTVLAALAGVASVLYALMANGPIGTQLPLVPFALVIFGGVSVRTGRGGVAGTALAAVAFTLVSILGFEHAWPSWTYAYLLPAVLLVIGLALGRLRDQLDPDPGQLVPGPQPPPGPHWAAPGPHSALPEPQSPSAGPQWTGAPPPGFGPLPQFPPAAREHPPQPRRGGGESGGDEVGGRGGGEFGTDQGQ